MKYMLKLAYQLGKISTVTSKLSIKPFKQLYTTFKQGRDDSKGPKVYTDINL